jgi:hypothetical protein
MRLKLKTKIAKRNIFNFAVFPTRHYKKGKYPFRYLNYTKGYVDICFWHGTHLSLHREQLVSKGRKHMKSLRYCKLEDLDESILADVLNEADSFRDRKYYK